MQKLQAVSHAPENLISRLRAGELTFNADMAGALLKVVDAVRQMLEAVEAAETDGDGDYSELIHTLERLRATAGGPAPPAPPARAEQVPARPSKAYEESLTRPSPSVKLAATVVTPESIVSETGEARASPVSDSSIRVD